MRFTVAVFGRELLSISTESSAPDQPTGEHDNNCSQAELANEHRVGFHIQPNPSLRECE